MKNTYGVCLGIFALGLATVGSSTVKAQSRMEAGGAGSGASATAAGTPGVSAATPSDLNRRIELLEQELVSLRTEMTARKQAEEAAPAVAAVATPVTQDSAAPAKISIASLLGPTSVSGFVDTYYNINFNHPSTNTNAFRSFDTRSKQFAFNMMELVVDKAPDATTGELGRTGYHVALGYGQSQVATIAAEPIGGGLGFDQYVKEAYFSYLAPVGKGLQIDVGKFVTPMGAEVIESKDNLNYTRGLLFSYAIPYFHFGARAKYTFSGKAAVTGFLVNGWNNVIDQNSGKTYGVSFAFTPTKAIAITPTYLAGSETPNQSYSDNFHTINVNGNDNWRQTWDLVAAFNPAGKFSFIANIDYGRGDRSFSPNFAFSAPLGQFLLTSVSRSTPATWYGGAGYVKYAMNDKTYLAGRYEYYEDHDGFTTATGISRLHFNEITATFSRTLASHLITRLEYRRDMANAPVFPIADFASGVKQQSTITMGLIFMFDSRDAK